MALSDFSPVGAESSAWAVPVEHAPVGSSWVGVAVEAAGSRLDDFLYSGTARAAGRKPAAAAGPMEAATRIVEPAAMVCPHCQARLSSVERKMERCLGCGQTVRDAARAGLDGTAQGPLTIRI